jgi:hypothetical protein
MLRQATILNQDLAPGDIARLVSALLEGIHRGELDASAKEVEFLESVAQMLEARAGAAA